MISDLSDQLLEIISWLPTKEVVSTMLLSKRWKFLWKQVPKLGYDFSQYDDNAFSAFVSRSLQLQEGLVINSFKLLVSPYCDTRDVGSWIDFAVSRFVHELEINLYATQNPMITSLYTCKTLTCLKLKALLLNNIPKEDPICLSSLHYLYLSVGKVLADKFIGKLSAGVPLLKMSTLQGSVYGDEFIDYMRSHNLLRALHCAPQR